MKNNSLPWKADYNCTSLIIGVVDGKEVEIATVDDDKDAALIIRAVNSHDLLEKKIEDFAKQKLPSEIADEFEAENLDFEGAYIMMVLMARAALQQAREAQGE